MKNVIDEELDITQTDNKIKYKLTYEDGTEEIVQSDLHTPVARQGTEYDRELFESIKNHLDLISRYWEFTGSGATSYRNPNLTDGNRQGYTITSSGSGATYTTGITPYELFNTSTTSGVAITGGNTSHYLQLDITTPADIKLNTLRLRTRYGFFGWQVTVKGSNDGTNWTTLYNKAPSTSSWEESDRDLVMTNSTTTYTYFQIKLKCNSTSQSTNRIDLRWIQLIGYALVTTNTTEDPLPEFIGEIGEGQRLYIKTIAGYTMYDTIDYNLKLDDTLYPLPKNLSANTKYVLVYDGEKFVTESNY